MDSAAVMYQDVSDNETEILNYEKLEELPMPEIQPLNYFYTVTDKWGSAELPLDQDRMRLGKNPYESEVKLNHPDIDDVHIVLQRTGTVWHIVESGKNELMRINGLPARQGTLNQGDVIVIQVGDDTVIFSSNSTKPQVDEDKSQDESGALGEGEYGLQYDRSFFNFSYKHLALIGSDPICNISVPGEKFSAMISNVGRKMYITNLARKKTSIVESDALPVVEKAPLAPGSTIKIENSEIAFKLSKDMRFSKSVAETASEIDNDRMRLLALDADGNSVNHYDLMKEGSSFTIGRDYKMANIAIDNCASISRIHCHVIMYKKGMMLMDNSSTNGSFVNGEKIKRSMVKPGDLVKLGTCSFILCFCR